MTDRRAAFITGGGSGLGAAVARLLTNSGWDVAIAGRTASRLDAVASDIQLTSYTLDVQDAQSCRAAIDDFAPTALINAAAVLAQACTPQELSPDEFAKTMAINVNGSFHTCHAAMSLWIENKTPGDIVNISSLGGLRGMQIFPGFAAYAASKHAIVGLTEALANDGKEHGIRVNAIAPGMMRTPMLDAMGITAKTTADDVAPTVAWLLDRTQSGPITGTVVDIHCNDVVE